jgi:hypothetical protein
MIRLLRTRLALLLSCLALCLLGSACGDKPPPPPHHGLKTAAITSKPFGEPVTPGFEIADGATYAGTIRLQTDFWQRKSLGSKPEEKTASASAVLHIDQTFAVPGGDRPPHSTIRLTYSDAEGYGAETFREREPISGTMDHEAGGRALPLSLSLSGGTQEQQLEALDRIGGLHMAGFAGSPAWLPDGPVREGEAWAVERFLNPRGLDNARRQAQQTGLATPEPVFSGTVRVVKIREGAQGPLIDVEIDALIELSGPFEKGNESGHMSYANQVRGTATVSAATGLPETFDCTEEVRTDIRQGGSQVQQRAVATVHGSVQRK